MATRDKTARGRKRDLGRIGGWRYTVNNGVTGLLCEAGNPADLAEKIARLLDEPFPRRQMGAAGRTRFKSDYDYDYDYD